MYIVLGGLIQLRSYISKSAYCRLWVGKGMGSWNATCILLGGGGGGGGGGKHSWRRTPVPRRQCPGGDTPS